MASKEAYNEQRNRMETPCETIVFDMIDEETQATGVKFKKFPVEPQSGITDIIALFPEDFDNWQRTLIVSYMHLGQHSGAMPELLEELEDASPIEYAALKNELESIGYTLNII